MSYLLWLAAFVLTTSASQELSLEFRRQFFEEDVSQYPTKVACNITMDQWRNQIIDEVACSPREVYLGLAPPSTYESLTPGTLWVKRCVGDCILTSEDSTCMPANVARRNLPVTLYNVKTDKYECTTFTIEEHLTCLCSIPPHLE